MFAASGLAGPWAGYIVADAMMGKRDPSGEVPDRNRWEDNRYTGPWGFQAYVQGRNRIVSSIYPNGVETTLDLSGWQLVWGEDHEQPVAVLVECFIVKQRFG